nr:hypothetical protein [Tanacetum cinerariifolium]
MLILKLQRDTKHQDSRIKKAQTQKTKTSANSDIQDLPSRYQVYQGRLLASFQDDANESAVIDENQGRDNTRQQPKKRGTSKDVVESMDQRVAGVETSIEELNTQVEGLKGLDSNFTSMGEDFRVALNTLSDDLKREIHDLRDSFMGEIKKIREEFKEEREARAVDDFLWEMEQYLEGVNAVDDAPKIKMATQYLKDAASLWWRRRYGDIEQGTTTIDTWAEFVDDFKKQFYPKNSKNEAKSWLRKLNTRRESSKLKDRKVNQEKGGGEKNAQPKVDLARKPPTGKDKNLNTSYKNDGCFICDVPHRACDCPKKASLNGLSAHGYGDASDGGGMGSIRILNAIKAKTVVPKVVGKSLQYVEATINGVKGSGIIKAVNSLAKIIYGVAKDVRAKIGEWEGTIDLAVVPIDDFKVVLRLEFLDRVRAFPMPFANSLCILDGGKTCMVSTERDAKSGAKTLSAMQFKKGFNKSKPCYLALEELRKQLKVIIDADNIRPSKAPYGASMLFQKKKDGSLQMCIDYRALNKVTIKNKYLIPLIADLFDQLGKVRYFTKLDLRSGYYQVRMAEGDEAKMTCVTSHTLKEHVLHLKQVFQVLRDNEIYVKLEKCSFAKDEVDFLGHKINDGGLMMDGAKIKAIKDWQLLTKVTELRSFLGLVNYYRRFIMGYSTIASPLMDLLKKNKAWIWDEECQATFESLKKAVMEEPVLRLSDVTMPFELHTDASDFAIGGVLMQDRHPIAFESRKLNETERKYMVQEKEMTTVVHCLRIWRHYLFGLKFVIKTDNIATSYFQTQKKLSPKQALWQDFLAEFDYQWRLEHDPLAKKIIALVKDEKTQRFWLKGDMLFTKGDRLYVPKWGDLRQVILKECHDSKWAGHLGIKRTLTLVEGTYYWPRMKDDVETFSEGSGSIIVVVDRFSKYETLIVAPPDVTTNDTTKLFFKNVVKYWGVPHVIISDRDPRFTGHLWTELFKIMRTDLNFSTSFHPQTDGQTERVNALLELYLQHYMSANQHDWAKLLDVAQFSYNMRQTKKMNTWADERKRHVEFEVGDQVTVKLLPQQFKSLRKVHKGLIRRYKGPFPVIGRVGNVSYRVQLPPKLKIHLRDLPDSEASWEAKDLMWQFADEIRRYYEDGMTRTSQA